MPMGSLAGHARVSTTNPVAQAECDRCREIYNRNDLTWQYQWGGSGLVNTGLLVCKRKCLDKPFEQYRSLILPGDPIPVPYPRPSPDVTPPAFLGLTPPTDPYNQGFTPFSLGGVPPSLSPWEGVAGASQPGGFPPGAPNTKAAVLAAVAALTGISPPQVIDSSITITSPSTSQLLMTAQPARTWMLIYSPTAQLSGFSLGTALLGSTTTLMLGPGQAWFMATAQGLGNCYTGAVSAVGLFNGMPIWAWESVYPGSVELDGFGNPILDGFGNWILI